MPSITRSRPPAVGPSLALSIQLLALVALAVPAVAQREVAVPVRERPVLRGQWFLDRSGKTGRVQLGFRVKTSGGQSSWDRTVPIARLEGLDPGALDQESAQVTFREVRDAGTFVCRGSIADGHGAGVFELALDPNFARDLERRGVGRPTETQQVKLALADADLELLDALREEGYPTPRAALLVQMAEHGVTTEYVRGMAEAGYRLRSLESLVEARDHGVDAAFVRGLAEEGFRNLSYDQVLTARDHGATPEYIRGMRQAGARGASIDQLIELRDHGLDAEYIEAMRQAGYSAASLDELLEARDHGVDTDYVRMLGGAGFSRLPLAKVVRARDHGVGAAEARRARERLGREATIDDVIDWRDRGGH